MNYQVVEQLYGKWESIKGVNGAVVFREKDDDFALGVYCYSDEFRNDHRLYIVPTEEALALQTIALDILKGANHLSDIHLSLFLESSYCLTFREAKDFDVEMVEAVQKGGFDVEKHQVIPQLMKAKKYSLLEEVMSDEEELGISNIVEMLCQSQIFEDMMALIVNASTQEEIPVFRIDREEQEFSFLDEFESYPDVQSLDHLRRIFSIYPDTLALPELAVHRAAKEIRQFPRDVVEVKVELITVLPPTMDEEEVYPLVIHFSVGDEVASMAFDLGYEDAFIGFIQEQLLMKCLEAQVRPSVIETSGDFSLFVKNILTPIAKKLGAKIEVVDYLEVLDEEEDDELNDAEKIFSEIIISTIEQLPLEERLAIMQRLEVGQLSHEDRLRLITLAGLEDLFDLDLDEDALDD